MTGPGMPPARRGGLVTVFVLVAVAVLLVGAAVLMFVSASSTSAEADRLTGQAGRADREASRLADGGGDALADADLTIEVTDQLRSAVESTFSYDHADLEATARAVDRYLTGEARCVYDKIFAQVREQAPARQIVMRTEVRDIALVSLTGDEAGDEAAALVFVDQTVSRSGAGEPVGAASQFEVGVRLDGDTWRVARLDFVDQPLVSGRPVPTC